eukprot:CAMPEP_0113952910 /NCGR_PEP_ID=MMETSP1339-20121228/90687_1 /TAXON_ID=94617 /ORGANISM="Fibrocapsa japonica" /LENGTH=147 /DNA_ID=CAMNT_0000961587 /DNA_START=680 /DNA_END=1123 /DNA_ORIENTATION=+ /assembly_acc=CAM_ASM_000762
MSGFSSAVKGSPSFAGGAVKGPVSVGRPAAFQAGRPPFSTWTLSCPKHLNSHQHLAALKQFSVVYTTTEVSLQIPISAAALAKNSGVGSICGKLEDVSAIASISKKTDEGILASKNSAVALRDLFMCQLASSTRVFDGFASRAVFSC